MNVKELRIGNWVYDIAISKNCQIDISDIIVFDNYLKSNHPIPYREIYLTEQWILKFGFEKVDHASEETGYGTEYKLAVNNDVFIVYSDDFSCAVYCDENASRKSLGVLPEWGMIKTVHGLQNLVFALTGIEI